MFHSDRKTHLGSLISAGSTLHDVSTVLRGGSLPISSLVCVAIQSLSPPSGHYVSSSHSISISLDKLAINNEIIDDNRTVILKVLKMRR